MSGKTLTGRKKRKNIANVLLQEVPFGVMIAGKKGVFPTGNETILLVDDEEDVLEVNSETLKMLGYRVLTARGGREALEIYTARKDEIDLIILDIVMPEQDGSITFNRLRQLNPLVRVILASGYSINGIAGEIISMGCKAFLHKPFDILELASTIRRVLDRETLGREEGVEGGTTVD